MAAKENHQSVVATERQVLQALCHGASGNGKVLDSLRGYRWGEPLHQALFDLLNDMRGAEPELIRDQLPARLTRRGLPDFDLAQWFQPQPLARDEIDRLTRLLLDSM